MSNRVGREDKADFRALRFDQAGSYDFTISAVSQSMQLVVYELLGNGRLKTVKSITVNARTKEEKRGIFNLNLAADTDYFVAARSTAKDGTNFEVTLSGEVFVNAERGDDSWELVSADPDYTMSVRKKEGAFTILNPLSLFNYNWVGFGDTIDYRRWNWLIPKLQFHRFDARGESLRPLHVLEDPGQRKVAEGLFDQRFFQKGGLPEQCPA